MKVFIVEDNSLTRFTIKVAVEKLGGDVVGEAENFAEAMSKLKSAFVDVLLLDIILPDKSGLEVLKEFKKVNSTTKVIVITALEQDSLDEELMREGAEHILRKPFSVDELAKALNKV